MQSFTLFIRRHLSLLRYLLAGALFVWIFSRVPFPEFIQALGQSKRWTLPVVTILVIGTMIFQAFRYWLLLGEEKKHIPFRSLLTVHFAGLFYSLALPGAAAQDIVRATLLSAHINPTKAWSATWVLKLMGLITLALISVTGLLAIHDQLPRWATHTVWASIVGLLILATLSFSKKFTSPFRPLVTRFSPKRFSKIILSIRQGVFNYRDEKKLLLNSFFLALINQLLIVATNILLIYGITDTLLILQLLCWIPLIEIVCTAIPITPSGMGIRENLLGLLFIIEGIDPSALAVYASISLYVILLRLLGVLFVPATKKL